VKWGGGVEDEEDYVCFGHGFAGFGDAKRFGFFGGVSQACRVDELDWNTFDRDSFDDEVAGCAWSCSDDGSVALDEAVEKRRLTDVWTTDQGKGEAIADDAAIGESLLQSLERGLNGGDLGCDLVVWDEIDVVFGEVDASFQCGDEDYKLLFYWGYLAGERTAQLLRGDAGLVEGGGFYKVVDSFGLGEVEAAGEESPLGEFAWFGEAGTDGNALAEEVIEEDWRAVGGDLDDVLRGVGVGGLEPGDYSFVERLGSGIPSGIKDLGEAGVTGSERVAEFEEGLCDGAGGWAGEAHDADAAATGRGGDGDDGVFSV